MAAANKNTIVVVQSVGPVILESILALDGVKAVVWAGLGSQESGNALVDILYGSTNPSGKLPCKYCATTTLVLCGFCRILKKPSFLAPQHMINKLQIPSPSQPRTTELVLLPETIVSPRDCTSIIATSTKPTLHQDTSLVMDYVGAPKKYKENL